MITFFVGYICVMILCVIGGGLYHSYLLGDINKGSAIIIFLICVVIDALMFYSLSGIS